MQSLQPNSTLQGGKYKIINELGQGGFGITYLAIQSGLERKVCIKEFFMKELCDRDESTSHVTLGTEGSRDTVTRFREKFLKEARNIARLNHPNIVRIIDVFEENGTAYYVMEYAENGSLADKVKRDGYLSEPVATRYILQVASALDYIHQQKMNHLDVKPANIMLNEKDETILIDFGLSKQYDATTGNQTSTTPVGISEGYAPMEQYKQGGVGDFSPETDIYALGATFFKLLTGTTPPSASDVNEDGVPVDELKAKGVSQKAIDVIYKAMESRKKDRIKSMKLFIDGLKGIVSTPEPSMDKKDNHDDEATILAVQSQKKEEEKGKTSEASFQEEKQETDKNVQPKKSSSKGLISLIIGAIIVGAIVFLFNKTFNNDDTIQTNNISTGTESKTFTANGVSFDMQLVEAGTFTMGATSEMREPFDNEKQTHQVTLTNNYYIGKTEVTQALWKAVMGNNPSSFKGDNKPVETVSWDDCQKFISKLNSITGQNFRLPTEAEWEFAARGGNNSNHYQYSGSDKLEDVAWFCNNSGDNKLNMNNDTWDYDKITNNNCQTHDVATKHPNELGIYDMSGNVYEWCSDWYGDYTSSNQTDPTGAKSGSGRVLRGGSWRYDAGCCRSSCRSYDGPGYGDYILGLRLALSDVTEHPKTHILQKGESLQRISQKYYGTKDSVSALIRVNSFNDPNNVPAGTVVKLP